MNSVLKRIFGKSAIVISQFNEMTRDGIQKAYVPKFLYEAPFGYPRFADMGYVRWLAQTPYVEMCIDTILSEITSIPWDIVPTKGMEDQDDEIERMHIKNFFMNPNTNDESFEEVFIKMPVRDILEINSGILNKVYNLKEDMVEIVARDGATFTKNPDIHGMFTNREDILLTKEITADNAYIDPFHDMTSMAARNKAAYFQYGWMSGPMPVPFGKREIIWMEKMKRTDDFYGYSAIQILAKALQRLLWDIESDLEYYNDNNVPKGIIGLDESDTDDIDAFKEQWFDVQRKKDNFGNWKKLAHRVPIVNRIPTFTRIEFSAEEMQLIEKQKWYSKMVWACFGVNATELGYTEDAKGSANQIVQSKVFRKKAINPLLRMMEYEYTKNIIGEFGYFGTIKTKNGKSIEMPKYQFKFMTFDVDEERNKAELFKLWIENGVKTVNEVRGQEGLEEVEWGNDPPKSFMSNDGNNFNFGDGFSQGGYDDRQQNAQDTDEDMDEPEGKSTELKYKYVKRTGSQGHYKYWYRDKNGKLTAGNKPDNKLSDARKELIESSIRIDKEHLGKISPSTQKMMDKYGYEEQPKVDIPKEKKPTSRRELLNKEIEDMTAEEIQDAMDMMENEKTSYSQSDLDSAKRFLKEKPHLRKKFGKNYYEFAVEVAAAIGRGEDPETIDWASIDSTISLHEAVMEQRIGVDAKAQDMNNPLILKEGERPTGHKKVQDAIIYVLKQNQKNLIEILDNEIEHKKSSEVKDFNEIIQKLKSILSFQGLKDIVTQIIRNNYLKGWDEAEKEMDKNFVPDQNAIQYLQDYTFDNVKGMTEDIADKLRQELQRSYMAGEGLDKIKERVKSVFDVGENRAEMIARTETNRATNTGKLQAYQTSGLKGKKVYISANDDRTSALCKRLHDQEVDLDEDFVDPKGEWSGPSPPAHVNCRSKWAFRPDIE